MILPLLAAFLVSSAGPSSQGGMMPSHGGSLGPPVAGIDLRPLLAMGDQATMLAPARERWAIATIEAVGASREQRYPDGGRWDVFDVDLRVLDGWNVPPGPLRAFWNEDDSHGRLPLLRGMIGARALIRLAPTEDGRFLILSGADEKPDTSPTFAVGDRALLALVLPTTGTTIEGRTPAERRFRALWRAGASLPVATYPLFEQYVSATELPDTGGLPVLAVHDAAGWRVEEGRVPGADVAWLRRFARDVSPEFGMLVEENLRRNRVQGWNAIMQSVVERALRDPGRFPNGVSLGVANLGRLYTTKPGVPWPVVERVVDAVLRRPSAPLTRDLLALLWDQAPESAQRVRLLGLLADPDPDVRYRAVQVFDRWQGAVPKGTDPVAWHTPRAKLDPEALKAAKAAPGG